MIIHLVIKIKLICKIHSALDAESSNYLFWIPAFEGMSNLTGVLKIRKQIFIISYLIFLIYSIIILNQEHAFTYENTPTSCLAGLSAEGGQAGTQCDFQS